MGLKSGDDASAGVFSRAKWQSRRGMLELDVPLERFLTVCWHQLSRAQKDAYFSLMQASDPDLYAILYTQASQADTQLERVEERAAVDEVIALIRAYS